MGCLGAFCANVPKPLPLERPITPEPTYPPMLRELSCEPPPSVYRISLACAIKGFSESLGGPCA